MTPAYHAVFLAGEVNPIKPKGDELVIGTIACLIIFTSCGMACSGTETPDSVNSSLAVASSSPQRSTEGTQSNLLADTLRSIEADRARKGASVQVHERELAKATAALAAVDSQVGTPCGECGKPYCEHDLETVRASRKKAVDEWADKLKKEQMELALIQDDFETARTQYHEFQKSMTDVSATAAELTRLSAPVGSFRRRVG